MTVIKWDPHDALVSTNTEWRLNREQLRGEPPYYWIMTGPRSWKGHAVDAGIEIDGAFANQGGFRRVQELCQRIEDAIERELHVGHSIVVQRSPFGYPPLVTPVTDHQRGRQEHTMASEIKAVGLAEAADLLGMSRTNFNMHRKRYGGEDQCPKSSVDLKCGPIWFGKELRELEKWAKTMQKNVAARNVAREKRATAAVAAATKKVAAKAAKDKAAAKVAAKKSPAKKAAAPAKKAATKPKTGLFGTRKPADA